METVLVEDPLYDKRFQSSDLFVFSILPLKRRCFIVEATAANPNKHMVTMLYAAVLFPAVLFGVNNKQTFD